MSVLGLPIERQREIAAMTGKPLEQWRKDVADSLDRGRKLAERCVANAIDPAALTPEQREVEERFQARVDDEALTTAMIQQRKQANADTPDLP